MNIAVIGAGNMGTAIAADLAKENKVYIHSSKPELFRDKSLEFYEEDSKSCFVSKYHIVSNDYYTVVSDAEVIFISLPTFLISTVVSKVSDFIKKDAIVCFVPGAGGIEFLASELIKKDITVCGFERVPYVSRLKEYGKAVKASKKPKYRIATIPSTRCADVCLLFSRLFARPCEPMKEFIAMTLTPSLHTSRLYDLYKEYIPGEELDDSPYFYREWRDSASYLCVQLDEELHKVCDKLTQLGISAREVVPYLVHYESLSPELLTKKLCNIQSLRDIKGPLLELENGKYVVDIESRYFTESYPYRLCIVKGFADLLGVDVPKTDEVLLWYEKLAGKEYYVEGRFIGKDIAECSIPQNYGVKDIKDLLEIYV